MSNLSAICSELVSVFNEYKARRETFITASDEKIKNMLMCISTLFEEIDIKPFKVTVNGRNYDISREGVRGLGPELTLEDYDAIEAAICKTLKDLTQSYKSKFIN